MKEVVKCPKCGGELENGYVHAPQGVYWDSVEHKWHIFSLEALLSMWAWTMPRVRGWRCTNCRLILFFY